MTESLIERFFWEEGDLKVLPPEPTPPPPPLPVEELKKFDPHQLRDPHTGEWTDEPGGDGEVAKATDALQALLPKDTKISRLDVPQAHGAQINRLVLHRPGYDDPHAFEGGAPRYRPGEGQHIGHLTWHSDTGEISDVEVEPEYKRRGIATAMLRLARAQAKAEGTARPKHSENQEPEGQAWADAVKRLNPGQLREIAQALSEISTKESG